jgi:hypothetical protein
MQKYHLSSDGDSIEQEYYAKFIADNFPSYERFWERFVIPLSKRPNNGQLRDDKELAQIGKGPRDVCIAQLHYSVLLHLVWAYQINLHREITYDQVLFGLTAICGAQDLAFELLERYCNPTQYQPWPFLDEKYGKLKDDGKRARRNWMEKNKNPLQDIRDYRNNLIHGRMSPSIYFLDSRGKIRIQCLPRIGKELEYSDWRRVTDANSFEIITKLMPGDFVKAKEITLEAWEKTLIYLEAKWKEHLLQTR